MPDSDITDNTSPMRPAEPARPTMGVGLVPTADGREEREREERERRERSGGGRGCWLHARTDFISRIRVDPSRSVASESTDECPRQDETAVLYYMSLYGITCHCMVLYARKLLHARIYIRI